MEKEHRIIYIPAIAHREQPQPRVEEIVTDSGDLDLKTMQELVGGNIECMPLAPGIDLWFNEEGRLREDHADFSPLQMHETIHGREFWVVGAMFICASIEGESIGLTEEQAAKWLQFTQFVSAKRGGKHGKGGSLMAFPTKKTAVKWTWGATGEDQ